MMRPPLSIIALSLASVFLTSGNTPMATYHWLADGTKYKVTDPAGNGMIYAGDLTYAVTVSGGNTTYALESAEASADGIARFLKNGTAMTPYYTIRDHIGSVRTIVNASGTVVERNDYYPFGSRTTFGASYATLSSNRQKFSGKEEQTTVAGSTLPYLDFGARMYDAKLVRWNTYDPMAEKYYGINPYVYCAGDPVNMVDVEGRKIVFVHGLAKAGSKPGRAYWNQSFIERAAEVLKDNNLNIENYQYGILSSAKQRRSAGYQYAKDNIKSLSSNMEKKEPFRFVTHSMGAAFAEGMADYLEESGYKVDILIHLSPFQAGDIESHGSDKDVLSIDIQTKGDPVLLLGGSSQGKIKGADFSRMNEPKHSKKQFMYIHKETLNTSTWDEIRPIINNFLNESKDK